MTASFAIDNKQWRSPNHGSRNGHAVKLLLLHATVGGAASSLNWLCSPASQVSAHYVIDQDGMIYRLVDESACAWHAGKASWQGETLVNEISIGVELVNRTGMDGFHGIDPYPPAQVYALVDLTRDIQSRYPQIAIARHADVALPKGRKTDPIYFQFEAFRAQLTPPPPAPLTKRYKARRIMISQRPEGGPPYAGELAPGEEVVVDHWYAASNTVHLASGLGFCRLSDLEAV